MSASINAHVHTETNVTPDNEYDEEIDMLRRQLHEARLKIEGLCNEMNTCDETLAALRIELDAAYNSLRAGNESHDEMERLQEALKVQTLKMKRFWSQKCELLLMYEMAMEDKEETIATKDAVISSLQSELAGLKEIQPPSAGAHSEQQYSRPRSILDTEPTHSHSHCGKALLIDPFHGNDPEVRLDDWLPTLERAAVWSN